MREFEKFAAVIRSLTGVALAMVSFSLPAVSSISGYVTDPNGQPLPQVMVTLNAGPDQPGADVVSVFTSKAGYFSFPSATGNSLKGSPSVSARALGYTQLMRTGLAKADPSSGDLLQFNVVMRRASNQAHVAPASAWLAKIPGETRAKLVLNCVSCHQIPSPEVRSYAKAIDDLDAPDPAFARAQSWRAIARYMNLIWAEELGRGNPDAPPVKTKHAYSIGDVEGIARILSEHFTGSMQSLPAYDYGAPLAVRPATTIYEYEVPRPNAIREALMLGDPPQLWIADVSSDRIIAVDIRTGKQKIYDIPAGVDVGPHTLHPGPDRSLWIAPFFNGVLAHLDIDSGKWRVWQLRTKRGTPAGIHDLSFGPNHELLTDKQGRIWFSDIVNNAVGYFHPDSSEIEIYDTPEVPGRPASKALTYGLAMTSDQKYIWYSQLGIGVIGCFNVETREFETVVKLAMADAGPRRMTMGDDNILYVPLYGAGQLLAYDTRARKQIGLYDLPDRASAPYAATWDPVRKVLWIPTSNADVIYRFDPAAGSFSLIPLPRQRAFLRMIDVDPETGVLVTSYANIVEQVHGPRMALIIDPGDGAYPKKFAAR